MTIETITTLQNAGIEIPSNACGLTKMRGSFVWRLKSDEGDDYFDGFNPQPTPDQQIALAEFEVGIHYPFIA